MRFLYRIQQTLALSAAECKALVVICLLLLTGFTVRYARAHWSDVPMAETVLRLTGDRPAAPATDSLYTASGTAGSLRQAADTTTAAALTGISPVAPKASALSPNSAEGDTTKVRVNVNTASARLLQQLPGIGPKLAERIVAYRTQHGPFARAEDLIQVKGIGKKTFERLQPMVFVEKQPPASGDGKEGKGSA